MKRGSSISSLGVLLGFVASAGAQPFQLPTANHHVLEPNGEAKFFAPTVGKPWASGTFGCVRTDGNQVHEGIDILHLRTDPRGEPADVVQAIADGTVAYINTRSGLSNYGNYLVIRHSIAGVSVCSLYAHLSSIRSELRPGAAVKSGEVIGTMGRTTNTKSAIGKDRAHLHLEIDFQINPRYAEWHARYRGDERNDHGNWNGHNLLGIDPWQLYLEQQRLGARFNLVKWIRSDTELLRVFIPVADFPWLRANPGLIRPNPRARTEGIAGYELAMNYMGLPFECTPRAASELASPKRTQVLYVNSVEIEQHHCRKWVVRRGKQWELTPTGTSLIQLLTF